MLECKFKKNKTFFCLDFSPNFLNYPADSHVMDYRPYRNLSLEESNSTINSQNSNQTSPSSCSEKIQAHKNFSQLNYENIKQTNTKFNKTEETKVCSEETNLKITKKLESERNFKFSEKPTSSTTITDTNSSVDEYDKNKVFFLRINS